MHNELRIAAFNVDPAAGELRLSAQEISFPLEWKMPLLRLQGDARDRADKPNTIPTRSLNGVIEALLPILLTVPGPIRLESNTRSGEEYGGSPWLTTREPIPSQRLWLIVQAWLECLYREAEGFDEVKQALRIGDLHWQPSDRPLLKGIATNGTVQLDRLGYTAFPSLVAERLIAHGEFQFMGETRRFMRAPVRRSGTELVTWPPFFHQEKNGSKWGWSYTVAISAQTHAGHGQPRIHFHYGVRRWEARPLMVDSTLYLRGREARSVYLYASQGWLGMPPAHAFTAARLRAVYHDDRYVPQWTESIPQIAQRLNVMVPTAEDVAKDPHYCQEGINGVIAAMVAGNRSNHRVGAGVGLDFHESLTNQIAEATVSLLKPCSPLTRIKSILKRSHPLMNDLRDLPSEERLLRFVESVGSNARVEIYWQTEAARDMLADRAQALLCRPSREREIDQYGRNRPIEEPPPVPLTEPIFITLPGNGEVQIVPISINEIGGNILPDPGKDLRAGRERTEYIRRETEGRAGLIQQRLRVADVPTLALVELPNYQGGAVKQSWRDPYRAIRLGLARTQRVVQFTTGEADELISRCDSSVRDGLRHLGYLPSPIGFETRSKASLPEGLLVAGVWHLRLTRKRVAQPIYLPVVVVMNTDSCQVRAWLPDGKGVRPYYRALCDIVSMNPQLLSRQKQPEALQQLRLFLERDLLDEGKGDVLILTVAQNARSLWPGVGNEYLAFDALRFDRKEDPVANHVNEQRIRLIRLRTSTDRETPEWFTDGSQAGRGYTQGFWKDPDVDRLYYSVAGKPHTQAGAKRGKQINPREQYAIPSLVEIFPAALVAGDEESIWAAAVDQWRKMGKLVTSDTLLLPLPLMWASRMDDYAAVIGPWIFKEGWEEESLDEETEE